MSSKDRRRHVGEGRQRLRLKWSVLDVASHEAMLDLDEDVDYMEMAERVMGVENARSLSKYMGMGKKQPYAEWVRKYV